MNVQLSEVLQPGASAITDEAGRYAMGSLAGFIGLTLSKEGYEPLTVSQYHMYGDRVLNLLLTPIIRIAAGESMTITLHDGDRGYEFRGAYSECDSPCKLIRVTVAGGGSLEVKLTAGDRTQKLSVFTNEGYVEYCCSAEITIPFGFSDQGEHILYVTFAGGVPTDRRIDIATSFQPQ